jgi:hypothetical protein
MLDSLTGTLTSTKRQPDINEASTRHQRHVNEASTERQLEHFVVESGETLVLSVLHGSHRVVLLITRRKVGTAWGRSVGRIKEQGWGGASFGDAALVGAQSALRERNDRSQAGGMRSRSICATFGISGPLRTITMMAMSYAT